MADSTATERRPAAEQSRPPAEDTATAPEQAPKGLGNLLLRITLATATTLVSVNLWTGGPLLALWVGSRIQAAAGSLSMGAVGATVGVLIVESLVLYRLLARLNARYDRVIGRKVRRQQAPWLKPMSGERRTLSTARPLTAVERIVVVSVVFAVQATIVWFFFFARGGGLVH